MAHMTAEVLREKQDTAWLSSAEAAINSCHHELLQVLLSLPAASLAQIQPGQSAVLLHHAALAMLVPNSIMHPLTYVYPAPELRLATVQMLLAHGLRWDIAASPSLQAEPFAWNQASRVYDEAEQASQETALRALMAAGLEINPRTDRGPLIHRAVMDGDLPLAGLWHKLGAPALGRNGNNPCHALCRSKRVMVADRISGRIELDTLRRWREDVPVQWWTQPNKTGETPMDIMLANTQASPAPSVWNAEQQRSAWKTLRREVEVLVLDAATQAKAPLPDSPRPRM